MDAFGSLCLQGDRTTRVEANIAYEGRSTRILISIWSATGALRGSIAKVANKPVTGRRRHGNGGGEADMQCTFSFIFKAVERSQQRHCLHESVTQHLCQGRTTRLASKYHVQECGLSTMEGNGQEALLANNYQAPFHCGIKTSSIFTQNGMSWWRPRHCSCSNRGPRKYMWQAIGEQSMELRHVHYDIDLCVCLDTLLSLRAQYILSILQERRRQIRIYSETLV